MNIAKIQFFCSQCRQLLECSAEYAGQDTTCPFCEQTTYIHAKPPPIIQPTNHASTTAQSAPRPQGLIVTIASWVLAILVWQWVATQPPETFNDQGGMLITFGVLPLLLGCWVVAGPVTMVRGLQGMRQIQAATRPASGRWMARIEIALGCIATLTGLGLVAWWMYIEFAR